MNLSRILRQLMLPLKQIDSALPNAGLIYEIGCGTGIISKYIASSHPKRQVVGIDLDTEKITQVENQQHKENLTFVAVDALTYDYLRCDGVVLSDFLHHLKFADQIVLLQKVTNRLKLKGVLIIKEIDKNDRIFRWMSRFWDFLFYPIDKIYYRKKEELLIKYIA